MTNYVSLMDEGVDVWRPVQAIRRGEAYTIVSHNPGPEDGHWQFEGETVVCSPDVFSDGKAGLVAVSTSEPAPA